MGINDSILAKPVTQPLVSVVMPAYNHGAYVESAVRSVWSMDYRPMELIVLNDGSTDDTLEILRRLEADSPIRMLVIDKQNEGICKTLNDGLGLANGKYITFLASDDEFVVGRQMLHIELLEANSSIDVAGCYGMKIIIDEKGNAKGGAVAQKQGCDDDFLSLVSFKSKFSLQGSTFKAEVVKKLRFDESLSYEDWDFFFRLILEYKLIYVPEVSFRYRSLSTGLNRNMDSISNSRMSVVNKYKEHPRIREYGIRKFKSNCELMNARGYFQIGGFKNARKWLFRSYLTFPSVSIEAMALAVKILLGPNCVAFARRVKRLLGF